MKLEEDHLLSDTQSVYRKNRSTEDHLVYLAQQIESVHQKKVLAAFVDLTKAHDNVCKEELIHEAAIHDSGKENVQLDTRLPIRSSMMTW